MVLICSQTLVSFLVKGVVCMSRPCVASGSEAELIFEMNLLASLESGRVDGVYSTEGTMGGRTRTGSLNIQARMKAYNVDVAGLESNVDCRFSMAVDVFVRCATVDVGDDGSESDANRIS